MSNDFGGDDDWADFDDPSHAYAPIDSPTGDVDNWDAFAEPKKKKKKKRKKKNKLDKSQAVQGLGLQFVGDVDTANVFMKELGLTAEQYAQLQEEQQMAMKQVQQQKPNAPFEDPFKNVEGEFETQSPVADDWDPFQDPPKKKNHPQKKAKPKKKKKSNKPAPNADSTSLASAAAKDFSSMQASGSFFDNDQQSAWSSFDADHTFNPHNSSAPSAQTDNWDPFSGTKDNKDEKSDEMKSEETMQTKDKKSLVPKQLMERFLENCGMPQYIDTFTQNQSMDIRLISHIDEQILIHFGVIPLHRRLILDRIKQFQTDADAFRIFMEQSTDPPLIGFWKEFHRNGILTWDSLSFAANNIFDIITLIGDDVSVTNPSLIFINQHLQTFKRTRVPPKLENVESQFIAPAADVATVAPPENNETECEGAGETAYI